MLIITVPATEMWDEVNEEFVYTDEQTLELEHSLAAISKWEAKYCKPFISKEPKTKEEDIDYIRCMTINDVDDNVYKCLDEKMMNTIREYMEAPMTATWFSKKEKKSGSRDVITSEVIYYWMTVLNIPFSCENWNFNRLMTLIKVCNEEQKPQKDIKLKDLYKRNNALNAARKMAHHTRG